jgi:hypothetical protein
MNNLLRRFLDAQRGFFDTQRAFFARLTQREQLIVVGAASGLFCLIVLGLGLWVHGAIGKEANRVRVKTGQLIQVLALQNDYRARQAERSQRLASLGRGKVRLVSLVEDSARTAGVDIGQLRPDEGEANADGIVESRVDLRAAGLSADRLQEFLNLVEKSPGVVVVRRLKVSRPYRRDTADIEMTVTTFRAKG